MRIISKFHDYYDSLQSHDDRLIYFRETREYKNHTDSKYWDECNLTFASGIVGFCGKLYPFIKLETTHAPLVPPVKYYYEFSQDIVDADKNKTKLSHVYKSLFGRKQDKEEIYREFFTKDYSRHKVLFEKEKTAVFIYTRHKTIINPRLADWQFYKAMPIELTFQELEMYLGSVLCANEDNIPQISNKDMIEAKGFDLKHSFRKEKS
jgi:hypothetical protein